MFLLTINSALAQWDRGIIINYSVINTNSSNYWDNFNSINSSQFENQADNLLGIKYSFLDSIINFFVNLKVFQYGFYNSSTLPTTLSGDVTGNMSQTEIAPNSSTLACQNITGGTDDDYCTDQTGAGATARTFKQLNIPKITGNNAIWNTTFNFPVAANTNYTYECNWFGNTTATATGLQINVSAIIPNRIWHTVFIRNPSTITAQLYTACSDHQTECISSGTAGVIAGVPIEIKGRLNNGITAGNINFSIKVEMGTGMVSIERGSYCFIEIEN